MTPRDIVRAAYPDYRGRKVSVDHSGTVALHDLCWGGGTRNYYTAIDLASGTAVTAAPGAPWSPLAMRAEGAKIIVPPGYAIVSHSYWCGRDVGCTVYLAAGRAATQARRVPAHRPLPHIAFPEGEAQESIMYCDDCGDQMDRDDGRICTHCVETRTAEAEAGDEDIGIDWYRDGELWIAVWTGMPEEHVQIGIGMTQTDARASLDSTPLQSVGRDGGVRDALEWARKTGRISTWIGAT